MLKRQNAFLDNLQPKKKQRSVAVFPTAQFLYEKLIESNSVSLVYFSEFTFDKLDKLITHNKACQTLYTDEIKLTLCLLWSCKKKQTISSSKLVRYTLHYEDSFGFSFAKKETLHKLLQHVRSCCYVEIFQDSKNKKPLLSEQIPESDRAIVLYTTIIYKLLEDTKNIGKLLAYRLYYHDNNTGTMQHLLPNKLILKIKEAGAVDYANYLKKIIETPDDSSHIAPVESTPFTLYHIPLSFRACKEKHPQKDDHQCPTPLIARFYFYQYQFFVLKNLASKANNEQWITIFNSAIRSELQNQEEIVLKQEVADFNQLADIAQQFFQTKDYKITWNEIPKKKALFIQANPMLTQEHASALNTYLAKTYKLEIVRFKKKNGAYFLSIPYAEFSKLNDNLHRKFQPGK